MASIPHVPLAAETVFHIGNFGVTNSLVTAVLSMLILAVLGLVIRVGLQERPGKIQNAVEWLLETVLSYFDRVTKDREKSKRFLPIAGTFFIFILLANWLSLLPGTGSIGVWQVEEGTRVFVPLLRPANSDLNLTIAMALLSVVMAHWYGIRTLGLGVHLNKFIHLGGIWNAFKSGKPVKILTAFVEFVVGLIELFGEFAKIASLSLRLFGNIFAGEVLLTVIGSLIAVVIPLPFMLLEMVVGIVQATVFSMLTVVYFTTLSTAPHGDHDAQKHKKKKWIPVPVTE